MARISRRSALSIVPVSASALLLGACGGSSDTAGTPLPSLGGGRQEQGKNDISPVDPAQLADGGDFRFPLDALPDNYNMNEFDGTTAYAHNVLADSVIPILFRPAPDGSVQLNNDYLISATTTSMSPFAVTYTLNPKAVWDNGTPITWLDFKAQWQALSGGNPAFHIADSTGYSDIAKVERGQDDKQVVVTFGKPFGDWKALFSPLYPKSTNSDPKVFNSGWTQAILASGGPFKVQQLDPTAKTVILVRNEKWWGAKPRLSRIIFRVVERANLPEALQNKEIDFYPIGSSVDLYGRARQLLGKGVQIRQAVMSVYTQIAFNGAPGSLLSDQALRIAIRKGFDVPTIVRALVGRIAPDSKPVGNLIFLPGNKNYHDHSGPFSFDKAAATRSLDALGWRLDGDVRTNAGRRLQLRYVFDSPNPIAEHISALVQNQLKAIGVELILEPVPKQELFKDFINVGNYDMTGFALQNSAFPINDAGPMFTLKPNDVQQNYGRVGNSTINDLFERVSWETDESSKVQLAQRLDEEIWRAGGFVPLYQYPGAVAISDQVANFGAFGLAIDIDWTKVGFKK